MFKSIMFKLSISNIAWAPELDEEMYGHLLRMGYSGIEIAPSRLFGLKPYTEINQASRWAAGLKRDYGLSISSMQSIWYGRTENIFRSAEDFDSLIHYSEEAAQFASVVNCRNLVFGCPKNRNIEFTSPEALKRGDRFFKELSVIAQAKKVNFGIEANPAIYHTNYLNTTSEVLELLGRLDLPGLGLNLDVGTMVYNQEPVEAVLPWIKTITHVHISEPGLAKIQERVLHKTLFKALKEAGYEGYISIEMGKQDSIQNILDAMSYVKEAVLDAEP